MEQTIQTLKGDNQELIKENASLKRQIGGFKTRMNLTSASPTTKRTFKTLRASVTLPSQTMTMFVGCLGIKECSSKASKIFVVKIAINVKWSLSLRTVATFLFAFVCLESEFYAKRNLERC